MSRIPRPVRNCCLSVCTGSTAAKETVAAWAGAVVGAAGSATTAVAAPVSPTSPAMKRFT